MNWRSRFRDELKKTLYDSAHPIFHELEIRRISKPAEWTKEYRTKRIDRLLAIAQRIMLPDLKKEMRKYITTSKMKKLSGRKEERGPMILKWAGENFPNSPILYSFWKGPRCIYVGVGESVGRLKYYKESGKYMDRSEANHLKVSAVKGRSYLHLVECLANHIYEPQKNVNKSQKKKYSKACPMCQALDNIEATLLRLLA